MFRRDYEVVVCGGGIAGVAAALAAARLGRRTALLEKTVYPGGLATTGLICIYLPLCDGNGTQVTFGLAEELLLASLKYGPGEVPAWRTRPNAEEPPRYQVKFSPTALMLAMDELLTAAGVEIWYDTLICATQVTGGRLEAVEVENKSGRGAIGARCFVDATGDADLAHRSGLVCPEEDNFLAYWALEYRRGDTGAFGPGTDHLHLLAESGLSDPTRGFTGIDGAKVSRFALLGREKYRRRLVEAYASGKQTRQGFFPLFLPAMAQFRKTRCIPGEYTLGPGEEWRTFPDTIGMAADWRTTGLVWEIPYRSLLPRGLSRLLAAGRCTAACGDAWEITRVIPTAALTGEAAGTAAALSVARGCAPAELPLACLQEQLRRQGNQLHFADVGLRARSG